MWPTGAGWNCGPRPKLANPRRPADPRSLAVSRTARARPTNPYCPPGSHTLVALALLANRLSRNRSARTPPSIGATAGWIPDSASVWLQPESAAMRLENYGASGSGFWSCAPTDCARPVMRLFSRTACRGVSGR
jgi:hypothetical protein